MSVSSRSRTLWVIFVVLGFFLPPDSLMAADGNAKELPPVADVPSQRQIVAQAFERHLFGLNGYDVSTLYDRQRKRLEDLARARVAQIDRYCALTEGQKQKLNLASRVDIGRLFERVEAARIEFMQAHAEKAGPRVFTHELQALQFEIRLGPFQKLSLFQKTLHSALSPEQLNKFRIHDDEEQQAWHHEHVVSAVTNLTAAAELPAQQRARLIEFIEQRIPIPEVQDYYGACLVVYRASQLSQEELKEFFTPAQWHGWSRMAKGVQRLKPLLDRQNFLTTIPKS